MDLTNDIVVQKNINNIEFLQFKRLLDFNNVKHAYGLKDLDFRRHAGEETRYPEYERFLKALEINPTTLVKPDQKHTDNILKISQKENEFDPDIYLDYLEEIDGTITSTNNITLASTNADCILILFFDPVKNVIANVHSGWRGTFKKISKKMVNKMKEDYGCDARNIIACICPSIRVCHFEVDLDVKEECERIFEYTNRLDEIAKIGRIVDGKQKYNIDTVLINKTLLLEEGLLEKNIQDSGICSVCAQEKVHSRRAEGPEFGVGSAVISLN